MGGNAIGVYTYTRMCDKADQAGFILACPEALGDDMPTWNVGLNTGMKDESDITFLTALLDKLEAKYNIDKTRVFMVGHSSGAMMAYRYAAEKSDRVAAVGVVAATVGARHEDGTMTVLPAPTHPVSVIAFHGTKDPLMPYSMADNWVYNNNFVPGNVSLQYWARCDGCDLTPKRTISADRRVVEDDYTGGKDGSEAVLYTIIEGDHWWPGDKMDAAYIAPSDESANATDLIWDFLSRHPRAKKADAPK